MHDSVRDRTDEHAQVNASGEILREEREKLDPLGRKIWESYFAFRETMMELTEGADRASFMPASSGSSTSNPGGRRA